MIQWVEIRTQRPPTWQGLRTVTLVVVISHFGAHEAPEVGGGTGLLMASLGLFPMSCSPVSPQVHRTLGLGVRCDSHIHASPLAPALTP